MIKSRDEFPLVLPVFFFFSSFVVVNIMLVDNHVGKKVKTKDKGIRSNGGEKYWPIIIRVDISTI